MNRFVMILGLAATATLATTGARAADQVGIPVCDDFLNKYEVCITSKIPAAQQPTFKASVDQMRTSWATAAKTPQAKPALEAACKQSFEQVKASTAAYGCSF